MDSNWHGNYPLMKFLLGFATGFVIMGTGSFAWHYSHKVSAIVPTGGSYSTHISQVLQDAKTHAGKTYTYSYTSNAAPAPLISQ